MANEPELREGISSEWVQYLQQMLRFRGGYWKGADTGEFDEELKRAVIAFQMAARLPATGVVDARTWNALTSPSSSAATHTPEPQTAPPDATSVDIRTPQAAQHTSGNLASTGAQPAQEPASHVSPSGTPAFRFAFPELEPVAQAEFDTGVAVVQMALFYRGNVTAALQNRVPGVSIDQSGLRLEVLKSIDQLSTGLRVSGIGGDSPSIGSVVGTEYTQTEIRFTPPNTISFIGFLRANFTAPTETIGPIDVTGQLGYELRITATPKPQSSAPARIETQEAWFSEIAPALAVVGVVVLIGAAIALAPETAGASLVLIPAL